jgi:hydroxymethylglutaryl-CoA lyase
MEMADRQKPVSEQTVFLEDEALRDGLQMESRIFSVAEKLDIFLLLKNAGLPRIQVGSFVHPKIAPQMANTDELIREISPDDLHLASALILNERGLDRALASGVKHVSMSVSVSDTHSLKNARMEADEALERMTRLIGQALQAGLAVRAGLQCCFGCVYQGAIADDRVLRGVERMAEAGAREINLADSTGMAHPPAIRRIVRRAQEAFPEIAFSLHLHDTRGMAIANMFAGFEEGIRTFDTCAGGLGGCPFIRGAAGNIPSEDAVNMFDSLGIATGIDIETLCEAVSCLETRLERPLPGRMKRVLDFQKKMAPSC